ncbi:MAG: hypothetical protein ABJF04_06765 [Reichenbachiella sp.]|uniref:hypothetical protein n=1 Tax=Reichenbachiella sp. TaxID=2184521 RepID=UPI003265684F
MENEILIGSNSDLIIKRIGKELKKISETLHVRVINELEDIITLRENQLVIVDLSVYTPGIIDRIQYFKRRFPEIELIAVTYTNDEMIDQMLVQRGIDQVASTEELPGIVRRHLATYFKTTG